MFWSISRYSSAPKTLSLLIFTFIISTLLPAQDASFRVEFIEFNQDGTLTLEYPSELDSYYILRKGVTIDNIEDSVDAQLGVGGTNQFTDNSFSISSGQSFYIIQKILASEPLDSDEDGIDDLFELRHPDFLNLFNPADANLDFDQDGASNLKEYQDGTDPASSPFTAVRIQQITPVDGERLVSVTRKVVVTFDKEIDRETVDTDSLYIQQNQTKVPGRVEVSSTNRFATFFPNSPFPVSTQLQVIVDGASIKDTEGNPVDAEGFGVPGSTRRTFFRTLSLNRIPGTTVWGFVKDSFSEEPIEGATIRVDAFPEANVVTDSNGRFELTDMPAPDFFVHIDGSTATAIPAGFTYPNVGKPFHSVPGQSVQLSMDGEPFDIYLPPMSLADIQTLSSTEDSVVGFGPAGKSSLETLFPEIDTAMWDGVQVTVSPGSALNDQGTPSTEAAIIPVPPDRIPAPLPEGLGMPVVISVQASGATRFDIPAAVKFPNLPDPVTGEVLQPGETTGLWSFNHDAGRWELQGQMTVSEDGMYLLSNPGVGITAPGWHGPSAGNSGNGGGGDDGDDDDCRTEQHLMASSIVQCAVGVGTGLVELAPGVGCAVSLGVAAGGAAVDCNIDPAGCARTTATAGVAGTLGCIPGVGLGLSGVLCVATISNAMDNLRGCDPSFGGTGPDQGDTGDDEEEEESFVNQSFISIQATPVMNTVFDNQVELMLRAQSLYEASIGEPSWWVIPEGEGGVLKSFMGSFVDAMGESTPGGAEITAAESTELMALEVPSTITNENVTALISRFNRYSSGGMTPEEQEAIIAASTALTEHAEFLDALGWKTPYDGFTRGMRELSENTSDTIQGVKPSTLYYKITNLDNGFLQRGQTNFQGQFSNLILPPNNHFSVVYADPETFKIGTAVFASGDGGSRLDIPKAYLVASTDADSDGDGLNDELEEVFGSFSNNPDSDGDGILDSEEFGLQSNPLDGIALPTGVIASIPFSNSPSSVEIVADRAYVTLGEGGLAIVDISDPQIPILTSQFDLPGRAEDVVVDPVSQIALVKAFDGFDEEGNIEVGGAHFVDVSNAFAPSLLRSYPMFVNSIFQHDGIFYVSTVFGATKLNLFHAESFNQLAALELGGVASDIVHYKNHMYVSVLNDLKVFDMGSAGLPLIAETVLPGTGSIVGNRQLHAENDVLYVGSTTGYATMDISDPSNPQTLGEPNESATGIQRMASNGSGLLIAAAGTFFSNTIDLYALTDPANIGLPVNTFASAGGITDLELSGGLLYYTDSNNGLVIHNYLEFDNQGNAPTVDLDLSYLDTDTQTAGIQVLEGSRIFIDPEIRDDFQKRETRFYMDDVLMESTRMGHQEFSVFLPRLSAGESSVSIRVEAADTGSNLGQSDVVTLELIPDTVPPQVLVSAPTSGGAETRVSSLQIWLNEAFDPASVILSQISLTREGDGSAVPISGFSSVHPQILSIELEGPLTFDGYQLNLQSGALIDSGGNSLSNPLDVAFVSYDVEPGTILWISDEDGNFSDNSNWSFGRRPSNNQTVFIERPAADPTITMDQGGYFGSVTINERFTLDQGFNNMIVQGSWFSSESGSLNGGRLTIEGNALFAGPTTFNGGTLEFDGTVEFSSDVSLLAGELDLSGEDAVLIFSGNLTPGDVGITCSNGATLEAPWITGLGSIDPELTLNAYDPGSRLVLPNLTTLSPPTPEGHSSGAAMNIQAFSGGVVELPALVTINPGRIQLWSDGDGSQINIPQISSITGPSEGNRASIRVFDSGTIVANPLTSLDYVELNVGSNAAFPVHAITSLTNGSLFISELSPDLSSLTDLENSSITAGTDAVVEIPNLTNLRAEESGFVSEGENSVIRFPNLQTLTGSQSNRATDLWTRSGGKLEFPELTTMEGDFRIRSTGENSLIDLTALNQLTSPETQDSFITASFGGTLALTSPTIIRGDFDLSDTGTISGTSITAGTGSTFDGPGTLSSSLTNQGLMTLNRDTGPVIIEGDLILDSDSRIEVTIGLGSEFKGSGKLDATGAATLGGTIEIIKRGAYNPQVGDEFEIMTFVSKSGGFNLTEGLDLAEGLIGQLEITENSVKVKVVTP